jgi:hypothetical protein
MPRTRDWRSPEAAEALKDLDRSGLAWEFLRRNPEFREHYTSILGRIESNAVSEEAAITELSDRWGCLILRDPNMPESSGPTVWRPDLLALGVTLVAAPNRYSEAHELSVSDVGDARADLQRADGRHILLGDPEGNHWLWLPNVWIGDKLSGLVVFDDRFALRIAALQRLYRRLGGRSAGPLPKGWRITHRHRWRLTLMLRALDGHLDQASYREIANALFGAEAVARYAWKTSSIRGQTIRLVKDAVRMMKGGYRRLLSGD